MKFIYSTLFALLLIFFAGCKKEIKEYSQNFNNNWKFYLGDDSLAMDPEYDDSQWRLLNLPHDWSIEGDFSKEHETGLAGGWLPAGIGWYRKSFVVPESSKDKEVFIEFDGVYRNSEVWINGNFVGKRTNGYISFSYQISDYLNYGADTNLVAVKVDNTPQPNSRWYTGSGIYRNVRLVTKNKIHIPQWGMFVTTPKVSAHKATVIAKFNVDNYSGNTQNIAIETFIYDNEGEFIAKSDIIEKRIYEPIEVEQNIEIESPQRWSVLNPNLYKAITKIYLEGKEIDRKETKFGIRTFRFDADSGFFLNGKQTKLLGVCNHHDLGALGAAVNKRAIERELEILKEMGCNAIRTAHNPPTPGLLDLCDEMGFLVMDEAFDEWKRRKAPKGYHLNWDDWHYLDLQDFIKRDRNHPSIIMWSIGNEIPEQFDSTGTNITKELVRIVKAIDTTRPVTCALTENIPKENYIYQSGALDVLSFNYKQNDYKNFPEWYPGEPVLAAETMSAFATRDVYNMPSDSPQHWPESYNVPLKNPNPDNTISAYDHICAYWGSTHEETWSIVKNLDFMAGLFVWSGFDFIGEPVPYEWPSRSSYYGIIDLAGFPKDAYYMYKSEWTDNPVLHVFPHWNWEPGQEIDIWAYYSQADEVELFVNGESMGTKSKSKDKFHVFWRVKFEPGNIKVVSRKEGAVVLEKAIFTAGEPYRIELSADRSVIKADGVDLSFVTVTVIDKAGNLVPNADNMIKYNITGTGFIAGVDNGYQANHDPFKADYGKVFKGKGLVIIQSNSEKGEIVLEANSEEILSNTIKIKCK